MMRVRLSARRRVRAAHTFHASPEVNYSTAASPRLALARRAEQLSQEQINALRELKPSACPRPESQAGLRGRVACALWPFSCRELTLSNTALPLRACHMRLRRAPLPTTLALGMHALRAPQS